MTKSRANKPSRPGAQGVKTLLTAASLAATLGGWATLSRGLTQAKPQSAPTDQIARAVATLVPSATPQVPSPNGSIADGSHSSWIANTSPHPHSVSAKGLEMTETSSPFIPISSLEFP